MDSPDTAVEQPESPAPRQPEPIVPKSAALPWQLFAIFDFLCVVVGGWISSGTLVGGCTLILAPIVVAACRGRMVTTVSADSLTLLFARGTGREQRIQWSQLGLVRLHLEDSFFPLLVFDLTTGERLTVAVSGYSVRFRRGLLARVARLAPPDLVVRYQAPRWLLAWHCTMRFLLAPGICLALAAACGLVAPEPLVLYMIWCCAAFLLVRRGRSGKKVVVRAHAVAPDPPPRSYRSWIRALTSRYNMAENAPAN